MKYYLHIYTNYDKTDIKIKYKTLKEADAALHENKKNIITHYRNMGLETDYHQEYDNEFTINVSAWTDTENGKKLNHVCWILRVHANKSELSQEEIEEFDYYSL